MREALIDAELCDGCQDCIEECVYDAIEMVRGARGKRLKAVVDPVTCCGCLACAGICPQDGIEMKDLRPLSRGEYASR